MAVEAQLKWIDGMQFIARAGDGPAVVIDDPESKGGASPMQLVLIGIAGCTAVDVILIMQKKRGRASQTLYRYSNRICAARQGHQPQSGRTGY